MSDEDVRLSAAAEAAQNPPGPGPSARAYQDWQARLNADVAAMQAGPVQHIAEQTDHHQGLPTVETQMRTHGQAPPRVPDTGGHG